MDSMIQLMLFMIFVSELRAEGRILIKQEIHRGGGSGCHHHNDSQCSSLQPGQEYNYRYSGRVASGITDIKHQFSAAGITFDVAIQLTDKNHGFVQFSNVEVGEFHDEIPCDIRSPLSMEYHRMSHGVELLEKPFKVLLNGKMVPEFLEVPKEPAWITNIRKAVVNIFRVYPFGAYNLEAAGTELDFHPHFSSIEENIFGICRNWYSVNKFQKIEAVLYNREHELENDIQREGSESYAGGKGHKGTKGHKGQKGAKGAKGCKALKSSNILKTSKTPKTSKKRSSASLNASVPTIDDTLWRVTRTNDFEDCECLAAMKGQLTHSTMDLLSRSSIGSYVIRGGKNFAFRIESAVVESTMTLFTMEDHLEHFDTFTNQTLELKSVKVIRDQPTINYEPKRFHSWAFEVEHTIADNHDPGFQPTIEQIVTGVHLTDEMKVNVKAYLISLIDQIRKHMERKQTFNDVLVKEMSYLADAVEVLTRDQILEVSDNISSTTDSVPAPRGSNITRMYIFHQGLITAGTEPAVTFLLSSISDSTFKATYAKTFNSFFRDLPNTIKSPALIPKLMEVIMQLEFDSPSVDNKAISIIGLSRLIHKYCFSSDRTNAHYENSCNKKHTCDSNAVIDAYIPYLKKGLNNEESRDWQRYIYLQGLAFLGTPLTMEILQPYILGTREMSSTFRIDAIWSLSKGYMSSTAVGQVFELLIPVFENVAEDPLIRGVAFLALASWESNESWWYQLAKRTWIDPSTQVANLISSTIKSIAHMDSKHVPMAKVASRVAHLLKPAAPTSITRSLNYYSMEYLHATEFGSHLTFAWLTNSAMLLPREIYIKLYSTTYLGYSDEILVSFKQSGLLKPMIQFFNEWWFKEQGDKPSQEDLDVVMSIYNEMKESLGFKPFNKSDEETFFFRIGEDFLHYLINDDLYKTIMSQLNEPHYQRNRNAFVALPSALGLPTIVQHIVETASWIEFTNIPGIAPAKDSKKVTIDISCRMNVDMKTLIPWSKKFAIGTGAEHSLSYFFPFIVHHNFNFKDMEVQIALQPSITDQKVQVIDAHQAPFTAQYGSFPTQAHHASTEHKLIKKYEECQYKSNYVLHDTPLGIVNEVDIKSDMQTKLDFFSFFGGEWFTKTPNLKTYDMHVIFDPVASKTKSVSFVFNYVSTDKTRIEDPGETESFNEESQEAADCSDNSQSSEEHSQESDEVDIVQQSSTRQRITKMQDQDVPDSGAYVRSIGVEINLQGTNNQKYEAVLTWATGETSSKQNNEIFLNWIKTVPEGALGEPHSTCFIVQVEKPHFFPFMSVDDIVHTDFYSTVKMEIHDGISCDDSPVMEIEGTLNVSETMRNHIQKQLTEDCGHLPECLPIDIITSPVYDHIHIKGYWTERFPTRLMNMTYHAYDLIRGFKFPDIYHDYTVYNPDHMIEIDATKCFETQHWNIHLAKPHEQIVIENVQMPYLFDVIASPAQIKDTLPFDFFQGREHAVCIVTPESIRTYDGFEYPYHPDDCWNVLGMETSGHDVGALQARFHEGQWEVRMILPEIGLILEINKKSFKMNCDDLPEKDERFEVHHLDDGILLHYYYTSGFIVKVSDNIYVLEDQLMRNQVNGLCGNYDGEKTAEMVGPKGCVYTDPELFVKSWTTPGDGCRFFCYSGRKRPVSEYQDGCPHQEFIPTGKAYPNVVENDCMIWHYEERTEGTLKCRAFEPTAFCKPHCDADRIRTIYMMYSCEETDPTKHPANKCYFREFPTTVNGTCNRLNKNGLHHSSESHFSNETHKSSS